MEKCHLKKYIESNHMECSHDFLVVNWKKSDKYESATQLMCRRCLSVVNFQDVAESCGELKAEAGLKPVDVAELPIVGGVVEPHVVDSEVSEGIDPV